MHRLLHANTVLLWFPISLSSPQDVDVYTGALSEAPLEGAIFGPLLSCLVSDQFMRLKLGDAHWYERKVGPQRFSRGKSASCNTYLYKEYIYYIVLIIIRTPFAAQLAEIYKSSLAAIICRNSDSIHRVREHVMERRRRNGNRDVDCVQLEGFEFNFEPWSGNKQTVKLHKATFSQPMSLVRAMKAPNSTLARVHTSSLET